MKTLVDSTDWRSYLRSWPPARKPGILLAIDFEFVEVEEPPRPVPAQSMK
jgi:hypothetical protein